jgi:outer membrane lipoprotein
MDKYKITSWFFLPILTLGLISCTSNPPSILQLPATVTSVPLHSTDLKQFIGQTVRWGGTIIDIKNSKDSSQITILGYPLDEQARPKTRSRINTRRFIANFNKFIEPKTYAKDTEITVIGKLNRIDENKIGEFNYEYPVVTVEGHALWTKADDYEYAPYRYDLYYPWYGYPYYPYSWSYGSHHHH